MAKTNKTRETEANVDTFLESISDEKKRADCATVCRMMEKLTGSEPKMWGASMVGFGNYHYKYDSGHEGDWFLAGFSPRKANLTLYLMAGYDHFPELMKRLGKYKTGKSCIYINKLEDINLEVLEELIASSVKRSKETHG